MERTAVDLLASPAAPGVEHAVRARRLVLLGHGLVESLRQIERHRLRTSLALSGIAVGVAAVVGSFALTDAFAGLLRASWERVIAPGAGVVSSRSVVYKGGREVAVPKVYPLSLEDHVALPALVPAIELLAPNTVDRATVRTARATVPDVIVVGAGPDYPRIRSFMVEAGRALDERDEAGARRVMVLHRDFADELFVGDPLGQEALIGGQRFVVVGIFRAIPSGQVNRRIFVPFRTACDRLGRKLADAGAWVKTRHGTDPAAVTEEILRALLRRHPGSRRDGFRVRFFGEFESRFLKEIETQGDVVVAVAFLCLLAGAVGVLNVFLISVTERTREIGLRLALGASRRGILGQILLEALVLCAIGGLAGVGLGIGIAAGAQAALRSRMKPGTNPGTFLDSDPGLFSVHVDTRGVLMALAIIVVTALAAGLYPAWRASRLDLAESLRHE